MPISKYFKLIKRSSNDFDIVQVSKPPKLPAIPRYEFKNPGGKPEQSAPPPVAADPAESKIIQGSTGDAIPSPPKEEKRASSKVAAKPDDRRPSKSAAPVDGKASVKPKPKAPAGGKERGQIKMDEEPKTTGCSCAIF